MPSRFPHGIFAGGMPILGAYIPPIIGTYYHVCPGNASILNYQGNQVVGNNGNDGLTPETPLADANEAYTRCTSGAGDGIVLWSYGTTTAATSTYLSAGITWSKHGITMVGVCAPGATTHRSRITNASTALTLATLLNVTGNNNTFLNLFVGNYGSGAAALGGVDVSGSRNYFGNCHLVGAGHTTPAQLTGSYSLQLTGAKENTFERCVIGLDTVDQDGSQAATGVVKFASDCQTNFFRECTVLSYWSYANAICGAIHNVGAGDGITRHQYWINCRFANFKLGLITTNPPASLVVGTAPNNGVHWMTGSTAMLGYAAYDSVIANDRVFVSVPASNATGGLSVVTA